MEGFSDRVGRGEIFPLQAGLPRIRPGLIPPLAGISHFQTRLSKPVTVVPLK